MVEDHPDSRDALRQVLEYLGARVVTAGSGPDALQVLKLASSLPDLILADIRMPGMDGLELAHVLDKDLRWRGIRRAAVTGGTSMADIRATLEAGYGAHIVKPVDPDALLAALQRVLGQPAPRRTATRSRRGRPRRPRSA